MPPAISFEIEQVFGIQKLESGYLDAKLKWLFFQAILGMLGVRGVQGVRGRAGACVQRGVLPCNFDGKSPRVGEWKGTMTKNPTPLLKGRSG